MLELTQFMTQNAHNLIYYPVFYFILFVQVIFSHFTSFSVFATHCCLAQSSASAFDSLMDIIFLFFSHFFPRFFKNAQIQLVQQN